MKLNKWKRKATVIRASLEAPDLMKKIGSPEAVTHLIVNIGSHYGNADLFALSTLLDFKNVRTIIVGGYVDNPHANHSSRRAETVTEQFGFTVSHREFIADDQFGIRRMAYVAQR